ncbi:dermonecrotic toxin LiSicTox-betaID1-like [Ruditapes philippinarum]|uniref:dermonecrotic toxin LiSicTox-betaID1-like n=1 Tax=Ruditapes philippinarum TaxID=129788 RepID=UPI00295C2F85|nr:dermonecrotic toxin LiSicTox-betaID1-like [Ruditapes philippinarum]
MAILFIVLAVAGYSANVHGDEGFYNIAHMTNTPGSVDWALAKGANGVEIDLTFDKSSGSPHIFRHSAAGEACDCTCLCPAPLYVLCGTLYPNSVCAKLLDDVHSISPCRAESSIPTMLNFLAKKASLALIIIDSKIDSDDIDSSKMKTAGGMVVTNLITHLFQADYGGKVIISSPKIDTLPYLQAAVTALQGSQYQARVYFSIDMEKNNIGGALRELHKLSSRNIVYGTGISSCSPIQIQQGTMEVATLNKARRVIWTNVPLVL